MPYDLPRLVSLRVIISVVLITLVSLLSPAGAQQRMAIPDLGRFFEPDFLVRDARTIEQTLWLNDEQKLLLRILLKDYETDFAAASTKLRDELSRIQPLPLDLKATHQQGQEEMRRDTENLLEALREAYADPASGERVSELKQELEQRMRQYQGSMSTLVTPTLTSEEILRLGEAMILSIEPWQKQRDALRTDFLEGVASILEDDQRSDLPALARLLKRERLIGRGLLSGESIDLITISKQISNQEARDLISPLLTTYELQLEEALDARRVIRDQTTLEQFRTLPSRDARRNLDLFDLTLEFHLAVRSLNEAFALQISVLLAPQESESFLRSVRSEGYPRVYQTTRIGRIFKKVDRLKDLEPQVLGSVGQLREAYFASMDDLSGRLREQVRQIEPSLERQRFSKRYALDLATEHDPGEGLIREGFNQRSEVERTYLRRLQQLLPPEVWIALDM